MNYPCNRSLGFLTAFAFLTVLAGCSQIQDQRSLQQAVENFEQKLVINVDGKTVEIPLEKLDIFLVEDEKYPETFELYGKGVILVGTLPKDARVGYDENWNNLAGKQVAISSVGGEQNHPRESALTLAGQPPARVSGGTFTVEETSEGYDAKTPITGRIEIKVESPEGEKTYKGTFTVKGTTWG